MDDNGDSDTTCSCRCHHHDDGSGSRGGHKVRPRFIFLSFSPDVTWQPPPSTTLENEHIRSFSRVVFCHNHHHHPTPTNNIHHHPPPSKLSIYARFRGRWLSSSPPPFPSLETERTHSFSKGWGWLHHHHYPPPLNLSVRARFCGRWLFSPPPPFPFLKTERT